MDIEENIKSWIIRHISLANKRSRTEERVNGILHIAGAALSAAAFGMLLHKGIQQQSTVLLTGYVIFGLSMLLLYSASSMYHLSTGPAAKRVGRLLDHSSIYFLIAGTYTPVVLHLGGRAGTTILILVWCLALLGMTIKLFFWGRYRIVHMLFYIAMGWVIVLIWSPLVNAVDARFIQWALIGGITYTIGTTAFVLRNLAFSHVIWHVFVLFGSISFFIGIYYYL